MQIALLAQCIPLSRQSLNPELTLMTEKQSAVCHCTFAKNLWLESWQLHQFMCALSCTQVCTQLRTPHTVGHQRCIKCHRVGHESPLFITINEWGKNGSHGTSWSNQQESEPRMSPLAWKHTEIESRLTGWYVSGVSGFFVRTQPPRYTILGILLSHETKGRLRL